MRKNKRKIVATLKNNLRKQNLQNILTYFLGLREGKTRKLWWTLSSVTALCTEPNDGWAGKWWVVNGLRNMMFDLVVLTD